MVEKLFISIAEYLEVFMRDWFKGTNIQAPQTGITS